MRLLQAEPSCESHESSTLLTSGRAGANEKRQMGRGSSAGFLLEPGLGWVKSCVQRGYSQDAVATTVRREGRHTAVREDSLEAPSLQYLRYLHPGRSIFLY